MLRSVLELQHLQVLREQSRVELAPVKSVASAVGAELSKCCPSTIFRELALPGVTESAEKYSTC